MKVGDYVRTNLNEEHIIARIVNITKSIDGSNWLELDRYTKYNYYDDQSEYFKSSPNIIDLIEVGDYVNGKKVIDFMLENGKRKGIIVDADIWGFDIDEIKSIVTKEQFKSMEYEVKWMKEWIIKYIYLPTGRIRKSTIISRTKEEAQECFEESYSNYKIVSIEN